MVTQPKRKNQSPFLFSVIVCALVVTSAYADIYVPIPVASVRDGVDGFDTLSSATGITTVTLGDSTYALVAAYVDDGVQIIDITDPANPLAVASVRDGVGGFDALGGAVGITTVTLGDNTYALVTAAWDDGVQIIDITDPEFPLAVASVRDGDGVFDTLDSANGITTVTLGDNTYALVASPGDNGVQIIDITDPEFPLAVASIKDGDSDSDSGVFDTLGGALGITTVTLGDSTYALVTAYYDDGVQIIDITDPANPLAVASIKDGDSDSDSGVFDTLDGAESITTVTLGDNTYALVTAHFDDGVQIIDITDPANPLAVTSVKDGVGGFESLDGARAITITIVGKYTYVLVTAVNDNGVQIIDISTFCGRDESDYDYTIEGTANADYLLGTAEDELIHGYGGNDFIRGMGGDDCIYGGEGNDFIQAGAGDDIVFAGPGEDVVRTGKGVDAIYGEAGDDILHAVRSNGSNTLDGGDGVDICTKAGNTVEVLTYDNCEITAD